MGVVPIGVIAMVVWVVVRVVVKLVLWALFRLALLRW